MLTHVGTQTIETERLILRRFKYSDDAAMLKNWIADEKIQSLYSEPTYETKEAVKGLLNKYISSYEKDDYYRWAIVEKESGECIGQMPIFLSIVRITSQRLNIASVQNSNARVWQQRLQKQLCHLGLTK